ncbi:MAG: DUF1232 domain-containing protein [Acidobacteriota bacterium]|nr:MAG: DUF1232 domain-containing protein [Acidobacteriota bacterium]
MTTGPPYRPDRPLTGGARLAALIGVAASSLYLINPTAGIFELLPDNLPLIGNIDEAAAAGLLLFCLRELGVDVLELSRRLFGRSS